MSNVSKDQLHGWKEIAAHLGRDERTAKRWEKQRGLPVRRIPGSGRANVYILISELEAWLSAEARPPLPAELQAPSHPVEPLRGQEQQAETPKVEEDWTSSAATEEATDPPLMSSPPSVRSSSLKWAVLVLVLAGGISGTAYIEGRFTARQGRPSPVSAPGATVYRSPKAGLDQQYLQSLYLLEQRTPESLEEAKRNLLEVIARDPQHAPAFAQLANTYLLLHEFASVPDEEAYSQALRAAHQAIALDPSLPEAHASLGYVDFFSARNPGSAEVHFQAAIRLDPACALAQFWYGSLLTHQGRYEEALDHLDQAQRLQPTSSAIQASRAFALGLSGQREEALRLLQSLLKADPKAPAPHRSLARLSLLQPRDLDQYLDEMQKFAELRQNAEQRHLLALARQSLHRGGEQAMWRAILASERAQRSDSEGPTYAMAQAEAQLGHTEPSLRDLEQLCAKHDSQLMNLVIDPLFDPVRQSPKFQEIVALTGLRAGPASASPLS